MTEEDWNYFNLWRNAKNLSSAELGALETLLSKSPSDINARVQLLSYYQQYDKNTLKHANAEQKLYEQVLWFIANKPSVDGFLRITLNKTGHCFKPKKFAAIRQAWLDLISISPPNGAIFGNAASFIVWNDLETAGVLFEKAYEIEPETGWLGTYVIFCASDLWNSPPLYENALRERVIDVGVRSLETELEGAPFLTCQYVADAALALGRFEIVRWCAEIMSDRSHPACKQEAHAYLGLVALRESDRGLAIRLMQKLNQPLPAVFRLATELFNDGEKESIVDLVRHLGRRIKKCAKKRWLVQIENNELPDFKDFCICKTCR